MKLREVRDWEMRIREVTACLDEETRAVYLSNNS